MTTAIIGALAGAVSAGAISAVASCLHRLEERRARLKFWLLNLRWMKIRLGHMIDNLPAASASGAHGAARGAATIVQRMCARLAPKEGELHLMAPTSAGPIVDVLATAEAISLLGSEISTDELKAEAGAQPRYAKIIHDNLRTLAGRVECALDACEQDYRRNHWLRHRLDDDIRWVDARMAHRTEGASAANIPPRQ